MKKYHRTFFPLLRFSIGSLFWLLPALLMMFVADRIWRIGEWDGFEHFLGSPNMFTIPVAIGFSFFKEVKTGTRFTTGYTVIPHGEFLLTRPILRKQAYQPRVFLYFLVILAAPLVRLGLDLRQPDMQFSLYRVSFESTEAAENLSRYQAAFPNSRVIRKKNQKYETLVVPHGSAFVAGWDLLVTMLFALGMQVVSLPNLSKFVRAFPVIMVLLIFVPPILWDRAFLVERVFFFFARHWGLVALLTLALTAWIQCFASKRAQQMEVI